MKLRRRLGSVSGFAMGHFLATGLTESQFESDIGGVVKLNGRAAGETCACCAFRVHPVPGSSTLPSSLRCQKAENL